MSKYHNHGLERFDQQFAETTEERNERLAKRRKERASIDPRDPDTSRTGVFVLHNCWRCQNGAARCVSGDPRQCEYLHARND
jgi:hypothetical protein